MNRRNFLTLFSAGVAGIALDQAIPFNRVWSFPKKIVISDSGVLGCASGFDWDDEVNVGTLTPFRIPQRSLPDMYGVNFQWVGYESAVKAQRSPLLTLAFRPAPRRSSS